MSIRFRNTRTGKTTQARDAKDAAAMVKIEQDRRTGAELAAAPTTAPPWRLNSAGHWERVE